MKLLISKKIFISFLLFSLIVAGLLVLTIEVTPKEYNALIAILFCSSWMYGIVYGKFSSMVRKAKSEGK